MVNSVNCGVVCSLVVWCCVVTYFVWCGVVTYCAWFGWCGDMVEFYVV